VDGVTQALTALRLSGADLVLCDVQHDVAWLLNGMESERIVCPVIACGKNSDSVAAVKAVQAGAKEFLPLPPDAELIAAMLQAVSDDQVGGGSAKSFDPAMQTVFDRAIQVAKAEASVLISGESGVGKEVMARHIHAGSRRSKGPFVALNCAALPESLLESELFGHEKGAFSGAIAQRKGKFEQAHGGTLLLDEIGEMDIRLQAKLLRALQEKEIDRLGGSSPVKVDVRILAATNRDLYGEVRAGKFREDLYFRLNVVPIRIPPLRERRGDILPFSEVFIRRFSAANGLSSRKLSKEAKEVMLSYRWPGNVRELENAMHRAVLLSGGEEIGPADIELMAELMGSSDAENPRGLVGKKVEEVERVLIIDTLAHCVGDRVKAAELLGISIKSLRQKLASYDGSGSAA
jgi:DNA-binding NtrC family response regulator